MVAQLLWLNRPNRRLRLPEQRLYFGPRFPDEGLETKQPCRRKTTVPSNHETHERPDISRKKVRERAFGIIGIPFATLRPQLSPTYSATSRPIATNDHPSTDTGQ